MKHKLLISMTIAAASVLVPLYAILADTCTPGSGVICDPIGTTLCGLLTGILNAVLIIGAPIAVVFVIIAGTKYVVALGKPDAIRQANKNLMWTLFGIAIFFGALVITKVIFTTVSQFLSQNGQTNALNCNI